MPETPQELHRRVADALRTPPVHEWDSWPFEGDLRPKALRPPEPEPEIEGTGGAGCRACAKPDEEYLWTSERWRLTALPEPSGLPVVVLLEPRGHYSGPGDLPDDLAREQGVMIGRMERAVLSVGGIAKVHIGRWGEGADHLHWWFIARPEGSRRCAAASTRSGTRSSRRPRGRSGRTTSRGSSPRLRAGARSRALGGSRQRTGAPPQPAFSTRVRCSSQRRRRS